MYLLKFKLWLFFIIFFSCFSIRSGRSTFIFFRDSFSAVGRRREFFFCMTPVGNQRRELKFIAGALYPVWYETQMKVLKKKKKKERKKGRCHEAILEFKVRHTKKKGRKKIEKLLQTSPPPTWIVNLNSRCHASSQEPPNQRWPPRAIYHRRSCPITRALDEKYALKAIRNPVCPVAPLTDSVRRLCLTDSCPFSVFFCHKRSIVLLPSLLGLSSPSRWDSCRACSQRDGEGKHSDGGRYEKWLSVWLVSAGLLVSSALLVAKAVRVFLTTTDSKRSDYSSKRRLLGNVDVFSGIKTVSTTIKPWNVALLWGICKTEAPVTHAPFSPCAPFFFFFSIRKSAVRLWSIHVFTCRLQDCQKEKRRKKKMCREQKKPKACIASDEEFEKETKPVSIIHAEEKKTKKT